MHYTPKHGNWPDVAEIELAILGYSVGTGAWTTRKS